MTTKSDTERADKCKSLLAKVTGAHPPVFDAAAEIAAINAAAQIAAIDRARHMTLIGSKGRHR